MGTRKIHIWLVYDDTIFRKIFEKTLSHLPLKYSLKEFSSCIEFRTHIHAMDNFQDSLPKYLFIDVNLPAMTGWELLNDIARSGVWKQATEKPLVYMVSSSIHPEDRARASKHSMVSGFCSKPIEEFTLSGLLHIG